MTEAAQSAPVRRDKPRGLVFGVLAKLSQRTGIDVVVLRVLFIVLAVATGGIALLGYVVAWAATPPLRRATPRPFWPGRRPVVRRYWRVAAGVGLLTLSALLAFRELGIWWSDAIAWPLALAAFGAALLWQRSRGGSAAPSVPERTWAERPAPPQPTRRSPGIGDLYSGVFGVLLVIGAALLFLSSNHVLGGLRDAALTAVVVIVALGLIGAPFLWRLGRNLAAERAERIRSQERAEVAAHVHDSVLQTLTLVQKRAHDPREVAALARRQERELRDWLAGDGRARAEASFALTLRAAAEEVEDLHRVPIEVVVVGDCEIDERADAVLGAAREALLNAATHGADSEPIRVYAEVSDTTIEAFVRDRGPGFEPAAVPADRRGVRESIVGRMQRAGGRAEVRSAPWVGTEVSLRIRRTQGGNEANR
jgi:signal transduction histidine kinase/phage shock protein PspC (stress-responsive transcriptional regulator)